MRCEACGYGTFATGSDLVRPRDFIEVSMVEIGPYFMGTPKDLPPGTSCPPAVRRGTPKQVYACPECGTLRIEV